MDGYLGAAGQAVELLRQPEIAEAWERPNALAEMTVGGLAGHLAFQIFSVDPVLVLLARLAGRRHGRAALLRALSRVERAPAAVNAI
jgi:hypothetical protein